MQPQNYSHVQCAHECLTSDEVYKTFKRDTRYTEVLEHVSPDLGLKYLTLIKREFPEIFDQLDWEVLHKNDCIGNPHTHNYENFLTCPNPNFSPSNFRYVHTGLRILQYLKEGNLSSPRIVEIGGGYGGQLYIINALSKHFDINIEQWFLIDLKTIALHQEKYLKDMGVNNFECCSFEDIRDGVKECESHDLLVSNYALAEVSKDIQDMYIEKVAPKCSNYFVIWNTPQIHPYFSSPRFTHSSEGVSSGPHNKLITSAHKV